MLKLLTATVTLLVCFDASADWTLVDRGEQATFYIDYPSLRVTGTTVKVWTLVDLKKAQTTTNGVSVLSIKAQDEHDCANDLVRTLYLSQHSGRMGSGEVVMHLSDVVDKWAPVPPDSTVARVHKLACMVKR